MPSTMPTPIGSDAERPRLAPRARLSFDPARQRHVLLTPETVTLLNDTGAAVLRLCDGTRTVAGILAELRGRYDRVAEDDVRQFLAGLLARRRLEVADG